MRKLCFLFTFLIVSTTIAFSQESKCVVVKNSLGESKFSLSAVRSIKFTNGEIVINEKDGASSNWDINNFASFSFETTEFTAIENLPMDLISVVDGMLRINAPEASVVSVYNASGVKLYENFIFASGLCVDVREKGIYVIKINDRTFKLMLK